MFNAAPDERNHTKEIGLAVLTAALTTAAHGLVTWGIQELQIKFGSKPKPKDPNPEKDCKDLQE